MLNTFKANTFLPITFKVITFHGPGGTSTPPVVIPKRHHHMTVATNRVFNITVKLDQ